MVVPRRSHRSFLGERPCSRLVLGRGAPYYYCSQCIRGLPGLTGAHLARRPGARRPDAKHIRRHATDLALTFGGIRERRSKHLGLEVVKHRCGDESPVFGSGYGESGSLLSTPLRGLYTLNLVSLAPNAQTLLSGIVSYPSTTKFSGTIQRRLAWPLHKDDTHDQMGCTSVLNFFGTFPSAARLCESPEGSFTRRRSLQSGRAIAPEATGGSMHLYNLSKPFPGLAYTCYFLNFYRGQAT
jgi:hypothetical protein